MIATSKNLKPITNGDKLLSKFLDSPAIRTFNSPRKTKVVYGHEIEVCPECDVPLTITRWGLNEEAECLGCGFFETTL